MARPAVDAELWRRIDPILDQALELPAEQWGAFLDVACASDASLRAEVEALLAAHLRARDGDFLDTPAIEYGAVLLSDAAEESADADLAGQQVGPYRLLRAVGSGGMGVVYEAEDTRLGRRVAIKFLPSELGRARKSKERFLREARTLSVLDHPNLCTVHDVGESDGRLYIVLAYYEGETLRDRLARGPRPLAEAREVAIQVTRGLACAHEAGITHRDVKPGNVMLTPRGQAKVLDFGIARLGDDVSLTSPGGSPGTPLYMSPEQASGAPVDQRTDIWSVGVMLYEMIAGVRPFAGEGTQAVLLAILTQEPEPLARLCPEVPPELASVVAKALAKDPAARYQSADELLADLEAGPAPPPIPVPHRWRRALLRLLGATAVGVLLAFGLDWLLRSCAAPPPLRVAILHPTVTVAGEGAEQPFIADEVVEAALATLTALDGVQPLDPPEGDETSDSLAERRRSAEAEEVLLLLLDCRGEWCGVTFRRLRHRGGIVLATVGPFEVPTDVENAQRLAEAVRVHLQRVYPDRRLRSGSGSGAGVRPQDYAAYVALERRYDRGERLGTDELDRLDALLRTSPELVAAHRLAASIARVQGDLDHALVYATRAQELSPHDPGPLFGRFRIEMAAGRFDAARATLAQLAEVAPADARVQSSQADLLEARGELEQARPLRQEVARRRPTWQRILELATLEFRLGDADRARRRLEKLLEAQPDNQFLWENLAFYEAGYGELERAAAIYERLIAIQPAAPDLSSLGFVRFLLGDYAGAAAAYRQALVLEPKHLLARFNLATALEAQDDLVGARQLYTRLADELPAAPTPLDARTRMLRAQCLVRLGRRDEATQLGEQVLKQAPEDVQVLHQAAQLYALLGERLSALYYAERALKKGLRREWFTIPEFASLAGDPDFRALLDAHGPLAARPASTGSGAVRR